MIQSFVTAYVSKSENENGRIEVTCEGNNLSVLYNLHRGGDENFKRAGLFLQKKMNWSGELHCSPLSDDQKVWAVIPEWLPDFARFCEANDIYMAEALNAVETQRKLTDRAA